MKYSEEEKMMWVEDWKKSGRSAWTYAKANGLNPQTFVKWTKTWNEQETCLVEVAVPTAPSQQYATQEILIEKGDIKIHIPMAFGHDLLNVMAEKFGGRI